MAKDIPVRAVRVGDFVQDKADGTARLVRKVEVILWLDNGVQDIHDASEDVVWEPQEALPDVVAVQEEIDTEREVVTPYEPSEEPEAPEDIPTDPIEEKAAEGLVPAKGKRKQR